jgi:hypothetical protein
MITPKDIPLLERKLADFKKYQQLNVAFTNNRGHRWANRLQAFARWLWENREIILQILGVIIMFADDGTPIVVDESELDAKTLKEAKQNLAKRKPTKYTPHGEKVEDFTEPETVVDEAGYDIGLKDNPLVKDPEGGDSLGEEKRKKVRRKKKAEGEVSGEVQPGEDRGEDVDRHESDDV